LKRGPVTVTNRELLNAMIRTSDNTATNRLIALVGMASVNQWLADAGLRQTRLQRRMMDTKAAGEDRENVSTPLEMARLAEMLYRGKAVSQPASKEMIEILKQVKGDFRATIPATVAVAAKPGELTGVRAETGIVFLAKRPFVLSVMSTFLDEPNNPVPAVARLFYEHFQKLANSNRYGNKLQ
jgi:beta-lactamase class A